MATTNVKVRSELLEEYATLEYILLGDLRDLLEEPPDDETRKWLLVVLDALLDTLPREFDLQEDDGYLTEVLDNYPNWMRAVEQLHLERDSLFQKLKELRDQVSHQESFTDIANLLRLKLRDWMMTLIAYHRHENRLVQTALNLEVGVGD